MKNEKMKEEEDIDKYSERDIDVDTSKNIYIYTTNYNLLYINKYYPKSPQIST